MPGWLPAHDQGAGAACWQVGKAAAGLLVEWSQAGRGQRFLLKTNLRDEKLTTTTHQGARHKGFLILTFFSLLSFLSTWSDCGI